jgi:hypothetical protein
MKLAPKKSRLSIIIGSLPPITFQFRCMFAFLVITPLALWLVLTDELPQGLSILVVILLFVVVGVLRDHDKL